MKSEQYTKELIDKANKFTSNSDWKNAEETWSELAGLIPDNYAILINLAATKNNLGKYKEARENYLKCDKITPLSVPVNFGISSTYFKEKKYKKAEEYTLKCLKIDKDHLGSLIQYAHILKKEDTKENHQKAINYLARANALAPKRVDIIIEIAMTLYQIEKVTDAEKVLKGAEKAFPNDKGIKKALSIIYYSSSERKEEAQKIDEEIDGSIIFGNE